jgi:P-type Cu+ transporter
MTCDHCTQAVERALQGVPGVRSAHVTLQPPQAVVEWNDAEPTRESLVVAVEQAGYRVPLEAKLDSWPEPMLAGQPPAAAGATMVRLRVTGMHCASCVGRVESALAQVSGVKSASVNLALHEAEVELESSTNAARPLDALLAAVERAGYQAKVISSSESSTAASTSAQSEVDHELQQWRWRFVVSLLGVLPLVALHFWPAAHGNTFLGTAQVALAILLQIVVGGPFILSALQRLRYFSVNMDTLIALGTTAAVIAGAMEHFTHGWRADPHVRDSGPVSGGPRPPPDFAGDLWPARSALAAGQR